MALRTFALLALAPLLAAAAPAALHDPAVEEAVRQYEEGAYAPAVERLQAALAGGLGDASERTRARSYLASALLSLKEEAQARATLAAMLADDPAATVDPSIFPPRLLQLLEEARRAAGRPVPKPEPKPEPPPTDLPRATGGPQPPPLQLAPKPRREAPSLGLAFVPFGVGQFANGSPRKGAFFLGSELLAYGTFAVALGVFESKKLPGSPGPFQCTDAKPCRFASSADEVWQPVYLAALYTGIALTVAGIVEAIVENRTIASEATAP